MTERLRYRRRRLPSVRRERQRVTAPITEKHEAANHRQEPGEIVTGRPTAERVVHGLGAAQDTEEAKEECKRRPDASSSAAVDDRSA